MVTKPKTDLKALKEAAAAAQKALEDAITAGREDAIKSINLIIAENELTLADIIANKAHAIDVIRLAIDTYTIEPSDIFTKPAKKDGAGSKSKGQAGTRTHAAPFMKDGVAIKWAPASSVPPADVQTILDLWKTKKVINEYIALTDKEKRLALIVRIEKNTGQKATKEQLADVGYTREEVDIKAAKAKVAADAAKASKAK